MKYLTFGKVEKSSYKICILVNEIRRDEIEKIYLEPYELNKEDILIITLHQTPGKKKTSMTEMRKYITEELISVLTDMKIEYLMIGESDYYKAFTKPTQADRMIGYVVDSQYGPWKCIYIPNYRSVFYDPEKTTNKISLSINALKNYMSQTYTDPGINIIKFAAYPNTVPDILSWIQKLKDMKCDLTCDIEAFSLKHYSSGIGTITFCWSKTEGISFPIDYGLSKEDALIIRAALKEFFISFEYTMIYHNISFDVTVLIYQLFMDHLLDTEGLLNGLEIMLRDWHDTKLISYLATNSCAGNKLSLKDQAQEYAGNYANEDIIDITKIPLNELLQYNLIDGLSTWFVFEKHYQTMIEDDQISVYNNLFKPAIIDIIQMQLTGLPVHMPSVLKAEAKLQANYDKAIAGMMGLPIVQQFIYEENERWVIKRNSELKVKRVSLADAKEVLNPNSGPQLIRFLYEMIGLPVIDLTDTKLPATGAKTLEKLLNHTTNQDVIIFLKALIDFNAVSIILNTFIPALKEAQLGPDGWWYLFGNFNLGGTISGRLSSSKPNLQNIPSTGSIYSKIIKECFQAPPGWLFCGVDFNGLEDRISALTTKDPNKLAVYQGHVVYELDIDGVIHHIRDDDTIVYDGVEYRGQKFVDTFGSL